MTELARADTTFHRAYDDAVAASKDRAPIVILFADRLHVHGAGNEQTFDVMPPDFVRMKQSAHVAVAIGALFLPVTRGEGTITRSTIVRLRDHAKAGRKNVESMKGRGGQRTRTLLTRCIAFLDEALAGTKITQKSLLAFTRPAGERIERLMDDATRVELRALEHATKRAIAGMHKEHRDTFHVVVAGSHQARERSLGMQYFRRLLRDSKRLTYAENASSVREAVEIVAKQRFDRTLSVAFFGDAARMERDLLGDAATRALAKRTRWRKTRHHER